MKHIIFLAKILFAFAISLSLPALAEDTSTKPTPNAQLPEVVVYKSASCGCCKSWISHLERYGFPVQAHDVGNMADYKEKAGLSPGMGSCHTAFVEGYAIEGHVPAADIKRLLLEKPAITGLTVPGMPIGSPGMEVPKRPADAFQVLGYQADGKAFMFSDYPAGSTFE